MRSRTLTDAAVLEQLKAVNEEVAGKADGAQRLALLRRQAELGDRRDAAVDRARRARQDDSSPRFR